MQLGAYDYILKPFSTEQLNMLLQRASQYQRLVQVNRELVSDTSNTSTDIVGDSPALNTLKDMIHRVARTDATVLIAGETGTGKELIAQSIHQNSLRRDKPFIKVNCAAVSETLIESEFFGHEKGAFTGANNTRIGRFELADGGTLLLDEISEVSLALQAKLLRVLQENELERVGGTKTIKVDVRILATTNRNLQQTVDEGKFREDLYYRLNVFPVISPALREREGDVPSLAKYFLEKFTRKHGTKATDFTQRAYKQLCQYRWPGNVRELQNVVERSVILAAEQVKIDASTLPLELQIGSDATNDLLENSHTSPVKQNLTEGMESASGQPEDSAHTTLESAERRLILQTLKATNGNRTKAAERMEISIRTLFNKLNAYKQKGYSEFEPYYTN
jgi:DNA-binding NtrC family response regulator